MCNYGYRILVAVAGGNPGTVSRWVAVSSSTSFAVVLVHDKVTCRFFRGRVWVIIALARLAGLAPQQLRLMTTGCTLYTFQHHVRFTRIAALREC